MDPWKFSVRLLRLAFLLPTVLVGAQAVALAAPALPIKVVTYNTHHGGTATSPATTEFQIDTIAAENPDVVVLQEAYYNQLSTYVNGLNARLNTTAWHGSYNRACKAGTEPNCTTWSSESVMILTRLKTAAVSPRLIWAKDDFHVARATLRMAVEMADGTPVNVFVCHLPALSSGAASRVTYVNTFKTWAQTFAGAKLVGGDFNDSPTSTPIVSLKQQYADAWALAGTGSGYTHAKPGSLTATSRIDYWFSELAAPVTLSSIAPAGQLTDSDHLAVAATYQVVPAPMPPAVQQPTVVEAPLFRDAFTTFDAAQWPTRVITGTQDTTIPLAINNGRFQIGALKESQSGAHYYGISTGSFNLATSGCASVQLAETPGQASDAYAMFAVVRDTNNLYRWYQSGTSLVAEKKIAGVKTTLADLQYSSTSHQYLRIRKVTNTATGTEDVVFETAPDNNGVAGTYTERYRNTWAPAVNATSLKVELKAGTSAAQTSVGSAYWDNAYVATNCR